MEKYKSIKVQLALFFSGVVTAGLFFDKLDGSQFNFAMGSILAIFAVANVAQKKVLKDEYRE